MICAWCEETLDDEQSRDPDLSADGDAICSDCYQEEYRDECTRCGNTVDKTEMGSKPGEEIAVLRAAPALVSELKSGYYRVKAWPFFADGMIEAYFYDANLERLCDLDQAGETARRYTDFVSIPLCAECRAEVSSNLDVDGEAAPLAERGES